MQIVSGNAEQESMKVMCGSYFVADCEGPLVFLRGRHVHNLSLGLSSQAHKYLEYRMHSVLNGSWREAVNSLKILQTK